MMRFAWLLIGLLLCPCASFADDPARNLVEKKHLEIQDILAQEKTNSGVREKVAKVFESFADFELFGRLSMKRYWPQMTKKERTTFMKWFRQLIHRSYVRRFKANKDFKHKFRGTTQVKGNKAYVRTVIRTDKTEADVDYKLVLRADTHRVYDIVIDDVSLVRNYRKQFRSVLKSHCGKQNLCPKGFSDLVQRIKDKVATKGDDLNNL